ncbi:MAG TPA: hypothetical protein VMT46_16835 [Anaerolineaceae bacterium]|nr:hypothetical protein [Anaerolineaceae bacterium]
MAIEIDAVNFENRSQVRSFLDLPFRLYRETQQWVPPLGDDERSKLNRRHPFYSHSEAQFLLARRGAKTVGRLAVLDNRRYNEHNGERTAFFTFFECENDREAAAGLFAAAETWSRQRGLNCLSGPKGFTALDGLGLLTRGFEHRPALGIPYHLPYYAALLEGCAFSPRGEILSGYFPVEQAWPEKIRIAAERVQERRGLRVAALRSRRALLALAPDLERMYNQAIQDTPGNVPLTHDEIRTIVRQLALFADPRLVKIIYKDTTPVGFLLAYPDVSAAIQRCRGRLLPFGWLDLLIELRRTQAININGAGIVEEYRGFGGTAILFNEIYKSLARRGCRQVEIVQIGADNERMLNELRMVGVEFKKAHTMYAKEIG